MFFDFEQAHNKGFFYGFGISFLLLFAIFSSSAAFTFFHALTIQGHSASCLIDDCNIFDFQVRKEMLLDPEDLRQFQNHSSQMAALDYMVSIASNVFIPTYDGNMGKVVEGHRRSDYLYWSCQFPKCPAMSILFFLRECDWLHRLMLWTFWQVPWVQEEYFAGS